MSDVGESLEDLQQFLTERNLGGSGLRRRDGAPWGGTTQQSGFAANHWKWADIYAGLMQSGKLVTLGPQGMTEMRTVSPHAARCPITLGTQILMPGERTRAHRNMKNETRLVWQAPPEAVFMCDYEAFPMGRGDIIVSPTWTYHDHWNPGNEPAIWIEGFDNGYATLGEAGPPLNERFPMDAQYQEIRKADGYSLKTRGHVRQLSDDTTYPLPPVRYPWADTKAALDALRESEVEGDPCDGLHLTLTSPVGGGPTLPTFAWHVQLLTPRQTTVAHRHNSTTYYCAFEGEGATIVEGERIKWGPGDLFFVPPWKWHHHENSMSADALLFSIDDWPAMTKLGFYKKEQAGA
jgi:gentisate 1,2-dioxygenase